MGLPVRAPVGSCVLFVPVGKLKEIGVVCAVEDEEGGMVGVWMYGWAMFRYRCISARALSAHCCYHDRRVRWCCGLECFISDSSSSR
jgi:hypothetical protein